MNAKSVSFAGSNPSSEKIGESPATMVFKVKGLEKTYSSPSNIHGGVVVENLDPSPVQNTGLAFGKQKRVPNKDRPALRKYDGGDCMSQIHSEKEDEEESQLKFGASNAQKGESPRSSVAPSSCRIGGLAGMGGGFGFDDDDSDDESSDNSIFTETDLAESHYAMSVRTYERNYLLRNPSIYSKKDCDTSGRSSYSIMSNLTKKNSKRKRDTQAATITEVREEAEDENEISIRKSKMHTAKHSQVSGVKLIPQAMKEEKE